MAEMDIDLVGLARLFTQGEHTLVEHTERGLTAAAKAIQKRSQGMLGTYQGGNGQFQAWPELADETKEQRADLGFSENDPLLRTGELRDHILWAIELHTLGSGEAAVGVPTVEVGDGSRQNPVRDIGEVALAQEMGTHSIPARSFLGLAGAELGPEIAEMIGEDFVMHVTGTPVQAGAGALRLLDVDRS